MAKRAMPFEYEPPPRPTGVPNNPGFDPAEASPWGGRGENAFARRSVPYGSLDNMKFERPPEAPDRMPTTPNRRGPEFDTEPDPEGA